MKCIKKAISTIEGVYPPRKKVTESKSLFILCNLLVILLSLSAISGITSTVKNFIHLSISFLSESSGTKY